MGDSILEGAASERIIRGSVKPSGSTKDAKGHTGKYTTVAFTTANRKGSSQKDEAIGLNSKVSDTKLEKE